MAAISPHYITLELSLLCTVSQLQKSCKTASQVVRRLTSDFPRSLRSCCTGQREREREGENSDMYVYRIVTRHEEKTYSLDHTWTVAPFHRLQMVTRTLLQIVLVQYYFRRMREMDEGSMGRVGRE